MNIFQIVVILGYLGVACSYNKYGRSCQDIGCPSTQECVMATDPCSYYQRQGECGSYPTCQRKTNLVRTCQNYVCPPTKVCKMDGDTPKCVDDYSKVGHVGYDTSSIQQTSKDRPSESGSGGNLYPNLPKDQTTPKPNIYRPVNTGGGYQGGQIGTGYPGGQVGSGYSGGQIGSGYPGGQIGSGYPNAQNGNYPRQIYPQQGSAPGYPQQGNYPRQSVYPQQAGYPQQSYPGYPQGNQGQTGYQQYPQNQINRNSGTSISDKINGGLKSIGLLCVVLKYLLMRFFSV